MWRKPWSIVGVFIPSLNGLLFTHKLPLDQGRQEKDQAIRETQEGKLV
jgi:hypothetical protein